MAKGREEASLTTLDLLTTQEAGTILKVSDQTIRDMIRTGRLPGFKVGRAWRIRRETLEKIIQG